MTSPRYCARCNADLQGSPIPQRDIDAGHFGGPEITHFRREIGIEDGEVYDGVIRWRCPDCDYEWPRVGFEWAWEKQKKT